MKNERNGEGSILGNSTMSGMEGQGLISEGLCHPPAFLPLPIFLSISLLLLACLGVLDKRHIHSFLELCGREQVTDSGLVFTRYRCPAI